MKRGKRLILYLMDGDPTDRIKCKLDNRTSIAYKIPRTSIDKCKNIPHLWHRSRIERHRLCGTGLCTKKQEWSSVPYT